MKSDLQKLAELSEIDSQLDELVEQQEAIPQAIADLEAQMTQAQSELVAQQNVLSNLEADVRNKEAEITKLNDWVNEREGKQKELKTNKEFHAGVKEISQVKKNILDLEAAKTTLLQQIEAAQSKVAELEPNFQTKKANIQNEIAQRKSEIGGLSQQIEGKLVLKTEKEKEVTPEILKRYKTIKARISPAMAASHGGTCQECNTRIPPQIYIELQKTQQICPCPRCHRILFV